MNEKIFQIEQKVTDLILVAKKEFKSWTKDHELKMSKIYGMIEVLSDITGKSYIISEKGLIIEGAKE